MRITRIDFEGEKAGNYATALRKRDSQYIEVKILTPNMPAGREHHVQADSEEDIYSMAQCLQHHLDGHPGINSLIHKYYCELLKLSDF